MRVKIHHEGTNILWALLAILLVVNAPLCGKKVFHRAYLK